MTLEERLDFLEFRQNLLFNNSESDRIFFENNITKQQYKDIVHLMDKYQSKIDKNEDVSNSAFENEIDKIVNYNQYIDYHFCEILTKTFMDEKRWKDVFPKLYGHLDKHKILFEK